MPDRIITGFTSYGYYQKGPHRNVAGDLKDSLIAVEPSRNMDNYPRLQFYGPSAKQALNGRITKEPNFLEMWRQLLGADRVFTDSIHDLWAEGYGYLRNGDFHRQTMVQNSRRRVPVPGDLSNPRTRRRDYNRAHSAALANYYSQHWNTSGQGERDYVPRFGNLATPFDYYVRRFLEGQVAHRLPADRRNLGH
jgi:hypothetical protein